MAEQCLLCGLAAAERHHPTARVAGDRSPYLDAELRLPVCHDEHQLFGDDQKRDADLEPDLTDPGATSLDWLLVRLRRLAASGGRCAEATSNETLKAFIALLAAHVERWANQLATAIAGLDRAAPAWRTIPEVHA